MKCNQCGDREGVVSLTQIIEGDVRTVSLCAKCAAEKGIETTLGVADTPLGGSGGARGKPRSGAPPRRRCEAALPGLWRNAARFPGEPAGGMRGMPLAFDAASGSCSTPPRLHASHGIRYANATRGRGQAATGSPRAHRALTPREQLAPRRGRSSSSGASSATA